jgi:hypothetical protein
MSPVAVNIRGCSGSGKTTLVRAFMGDLSSWTPVFLPGKKQPVHYSRGNVVVLGPYMPGVACGGADNLPDNDYIYERVREHMTEGYSVLYEGVRVSCEVLRAIKLKNEGFRYVAVCLSTSYEDCLAGVQARRDAKGVKRKEGKKTWQAYLADERRRARRNYSRLKDAGCEARWLDRGMALDMVKSLMEEKS